MKQYSIVFLLIITSSLICAAQAPDNHLSEKMAIDVNIATLGTFSGGDNAPFWLTNNQYGLGSTENNSGYLRAQTFAKKKLADKLKLQLGVDIIAAHNLNSDFHFQQLYADFTYKNVKLSIGSKERAPLDRKSVV